MKLSELLQENTQLKTKKAITDWMRQYAPSVTLSKIKFRPDMSIDVDIPNGLFRAIVELAPQDNVKLEHVPVKFGKIAKGIFSVDNHTELTSWDFLPESTEILSIRGNGLSTIPHEIANIHDLEEFDGRDNNFTSFKNIPQNCKKIDMSSNHITSLVGVHEHLIKMSPEPRPSHTKLIMDFDNVKEGGLGLLLIEGLHDIYKWVEGHAQPSHLGLYKDSPFYIIQQYLERPEDIYDCQAELIENGFEEFAKL